MQANPPGPRYKALLTLLRSADVIWNASRVLFAEWDLSPSQFNILNLLRDEAQGLTQTELGRALVMHRSNVTALVDRLESRGLVARHESAGDRRAWRVQLTSIGRKLVREILPSYHRAAEEVLDSLSPQEASQVATILGKVAAKAEAMASEFHTEEK